MKKSDEKDYFKHLLKTSNLALEASKQLLDILTNYVNIESKTKELHKTEHTADTRYHELALQLSKSFITPIDREDIMRLSHTLDDVIDAIEDIAIRLSMLNIEKIKPEAIEFGELYIRLSKCMINTFEELHNFKKPKHLIARFLEIGALEEEGDEIYRRAVKVLFNDPQDLLEVIKWREVFETMEYCCDTFERMADTIEDVVMKNN